MYINQNLFQNIEFLTKGNDWVYGLETLWVNFQKNMSLIQYMITRGVFSFVIWMKIPTSHVEQKELPLIQKF